MRPTVLFRWFAPLLLATLPALAADPVVCNVRAAQRAGTEVVDITYDVSDADGDSLSVSVFVSTNDGASFDLPAASFSGTGYGSGVTAGSDRTIVWNAGADWDGHYSALVRFKVTATDSTASEGMVLIPAGSFTMGDALGDGYSDELPTHGVYVSAFYMDKYEVTKAKWDAVYAWATVNGYSFDNAGRGKATGHPVHTVNWYDCVKWCNARSEKEGLTPCYYTTSARTTVYRTGIVSLGTNFVECSASGYRLPTEAEWEKAARGGENGQRFPWGASINHDHANYRANGSAYTYDSSPYTSYTYHPTYNDGTTPYTSPVGSFAANGYGLYDMAGNVWEWCWDWYSSSYYSSSPSADPMGASSGSYRLLRGGGWVYSARSVRCASRVNNNPEYVLEYDDNGFRCIRR